MYPEKEAAYRAQSVVASGLSDKLSTAPGAGPSQGLLSLATDRLNLLSNLLEVAESNAASTRSRLFGPWPEEPQSSADKPYSEGAALLDQIETLISAARRISEHTAALGAGL